MTTSMGVLRAESCVKPTMSEKKIVTDSYSSGAIFSLAFSFSAIELKKERKKERKINWLKYVKKFSTKIFKQWSFNR